MTQERLAEIKRDYEWHLSQPAASITSVRLSRNGMEVLLALEEAEATIAALRSGPGWGTTE